MAKTTTQTKSEITIDGITYIPKSEAVNDQ